MSRALFVIGGFGLGNSTRCDALIKELISQGISVDVATSANGQWYFTDAEHIDNLYSLKALSYSQGKNGISFLKTLLNFPKLIKNLFSNAFSILKLQRINNYSFIATDSEYSPFLIKFLLLTPLVTINNVFFTFSDAIKNSPQTRLLKFWPSLFVEYLDFIIQKNISDYQIAPVLKQVNSPSNDRTLYCPPLVRKELHKNISSKNMKRALVIASGSGIGVSNKTVDNIAKNKNISELYVAGLTGQSTNKVKYLGRIKDISGFMNNSDFIVSNGGYSTLSEALVCRKKILLIPIENHFEQIQNSEFIEALGLGFITSDEKIETDINKLSLMTEVNEEHTKLDGARIAASALASLSRSNKFKSTFNERLPTNC